MIDLKSVKEVTLRKISEMFNRKDSWFENFVYARLDVKSMSSQFTADELKKLMEEARRAGVIPIKYPGSWDLTYPAPPPLPEDWQDVPFLFQIFGWQVDLFNGIYTMTLLDENRQRIGCKEPIFRKDEPFDSFMKRQLDAERAFQIEVQRMAGARY